MASFPIIDQKTGAVSTDGTTLRTLVEWEPFSAEGTYVIFGYVGGWDRANSHGGGYLLFATFKFDGAEVNQVGTTSQLAVKEDDADWNATIQHSSSVMEIAVQGGAGDTVEWAGVAFILEAKE